MNSPPCSPRSITKTSALTILSPRMPVDSRFTTGRLLLAIRSSERSLAMMHRVLALVLLCSTCAQVGAQDMDLKYGSVRQLAFTSDNKHLLVLNSRMQGRGGPVPVSVWKGTRLNL